MEENENQSLASTFGINIPLSISCPTADNLATTTIINRAYMWEADDYIIVRGPSGFGEKKIFKINKSTYEVTTIRTGISGSDNDDWKANPIGVRGNYLFLLVTAARFQRINLENDSIEEMTLSSGSANGNLLLALDSDRFIVANYSTSSGSMYCISFSQAKILGTNSVPAYISWMKIVNNCLFIFSYGGSDNSAKIMYPFLINDDGTITSKSSLTILSSSAFASKVFSTFDSTGFYFAYSVRATSSDKMTTYIKKVSFSTVGVLSVSWETTVGSVYYPRSLVRTTNGLLLSFSAADAGTSTSVANRLYNPDTGAIMKNYANNLIGFGVNCLYTDQNMVQCSYNVYHTEQLNDGTFLGKLPYYYDVGIQFDGATDSKYLPEEIDYVAMLAGMPAVSSSDIIYNYIVAVTPGGWVACLSGNKYSTVYTILWVRKLGAKTKIKLN